MNIIVLTGSGISAESGLKTFRGHGGLWEGVPVEQVATPEAFERDPQLVQSFYNERRHQLKDPAIEPNAAHFALADFEKRTTNNFLLVTQNVDDLHERAGSQKLIHLHGELNKVRSTLNQEVFDWTEDLNDDSYPPGREELQGSLRPHIVWFGEVPLRMQEIFDCLSGCDLFVCIGSSGSVYPAAAFSQATPKSCEKVLINLEEADNSSMYDRVLLGPATEKVPEFFASID